MKFYLQTIMPQTDDFVHVIDIESLNFVPGKKSSHEHSEYISRKDQFYIDKLFDHLDAIYKQLANSKITKEIIPNKKQQNTFGRAQFPEEPHTNNKNEYFQIFLLNSNKLKYKRSRYELLQEKILIKNRIKQLQLLNDFKELKPQKLYIGKINYQQQSYKQNFNFSLRNLNQKFRSTCTKNYNKNNNYLSLLYENSFDQQQVYSQNIFMVFTNSFKQPLNYITDEILSKIKTNKNNLISYENNKKIFQIFLQQQNFLQNQKYIKHVNQIFSDINIYNKLQIIQQRIKQYNIIQQNSNNFVKESYYIQSNNQRNELFQFNLNDQQNSQYQQKMQSNTASLYVNMININNQTNNNNNQYYNNIQNNNCNQSERVHQCMFINYNNLNTKNCKQSDKEKYKIIINNNFKFLSKYDTTISKVQRLLQLNIMIQLNLKQFAGVGIQRVIKQ
eukprot:TRINITY_DN5698_c2_g1_i7.p1 TRINITY_DN5698_c2_g1~~TRINITY_DN5698_c2_g1_i7.p1  ORF type:complete len:445 (-),score=15.91 TRINITY_DN5698_c2_g1_i7:1754-3088(-)